MYTHLQDKYKQEHTHQPHSLSTCILYYLVDKITSIGSTEEKCKVNSAFALDDSSYVIRSFRGAQTLSNCSKTSPFAATNLSIEYLCLM